MTQLIKCLLLIVFNEFYSGGEHDDDEAGHQEGTN